MRNNPQHDALVTSKILLIYVHTLSSEGCTFFLQQFLSEVRTYMCWLTGFFSFSRQIRAWLVASTCQILGNKHLISYELDLTSWLYADREDAFCDAVIVTHGYTDCRWGRILPAALQLLPLWNPILYVQPWWTPSLFTTNVAKTKMSD